MSDTFADIMLSGRRAQGLLCRSGADLSECLRSKMREVRGNMVDLLA